MVRMWMVPPRWLCEDHLLGEHVEIHKLVGSMNKGRSIAGYIRNGLVEVHNLRSRHAELVEEMVGRGWNHRSPLPPFDEYVAGTVGVTTSELELKRRCSKCRTRIEAFKKMDAATEGKTG